ncbi:MAG: caspase family protein, partial [Acidobacteriota bacterium]
MTSDESTEPRQDTVRHALVVGIDDYAEVGWASLRGCVNDAELFHSLLLERFDFDPERVILLRNREATRDGILAGFDRLEGAVDPGDVVVFFFAGHGSRILDPRDPQTFRESLVAQDSGRGSVEGDGSAGAPSSGAPNRDILDLEILGWTRRLNERTPHVTLIFDCCHSGAVSRTEAASELDGFAAATRELEPDLRDVEAMFGGKPPEVLRRSGKPPEVLRRGGDGVPEAAGDAGWPLGGRRGTVLAACRGDELAKELRKFEGGEVVHHGAFSYFLGKTLADSAGSVTWRDVYERAAPQVCSRYGDQHPQLEGRRDAVLFGIEDLPPAPYLRLRSLADGRAQLAGGAAHGVAPGSRWSVRAGATRHRASGLEVGTLTVETADATSSDGPFEGSPPEDPVAELRAFLVDRPPEDPLLRVAIHNASRTEGEAGAWRDVATHIADAPLLTATDDAADADVVLRQTPPGSGDSAEASGTWEALGNDLRPVARPRPDDATGRRGLVEDLGRVASFRNLLSLENPDRASPLREGIELR